MRRCSHDGSMIIISHFHRQQDSGLISLRNSTTARWWTQTQHNTVKNWFPHLTWFPSPAVTPGGNKAPPWLPRRDYLGTINKLKKREPKQYLGVWDSIIEFVTVGQKLEYFLILLCNDKRINKMSATSVKESFYERHCWWSIPFLLHTVAQVLLSPHFLLPCMTHCVKIINQILLVSPL